MTALTAETDSIGPSTRAIFSDNLRDNARGPLRTLGRTFQLAVQGVPFRDAYGQVAANLQNSGLNDPVQNILAKTHLGATGNLGLDTIKNRIEELKQFKF